MVYDYVEKIDVKIHVIYVIEALSMRPFQVLCRPKNGKMS